MKKKRLSKEDDSLIGKVVEIEKKYINEKDGLVEVSFQVPCHDWKRLRNSIQWSESRPFGTLGHLTIKICTVNRWEQ